VTMLRLNTENSCWITRPISRRSSVAVVAVICCLPLSPWEES
jgi:hypothetical protein